MRSSEPNAVTSTHAPAAEPPARTEEELLEREERRARADLRRELLQLKDEFLETTHLPEHVVEHPFLAMALSAAVGFALASPARWIARVLGGSGTVGAVRGLAKHFGVGGMASEVLAGSEHRPPIVPL